VGPALRPLVLGLALALPAASQGDTLEAELRATVLQLRQAILDGDAAAVLRHVSREHGLTCTDTGVAYDEIRHDLADRKSHLYLALFDAEGFARRCGDQYGGKYPALSEKAFFAAAPAAEMQVRLRGSDWAEVKFLTPVKTHWPREYQFHREGGRWKWVEGVVVGRCTCG
jgi:hypothetical protein